MTIEETPDALSLPVAVIGGGMVAALVATFVFYPLIDRFVRDRFRLSRGQALSLLLGCALICGGIGSGITYALLHDDPRFQPREEDETARRPVEAPHSSATATGEPQRADRVGPAPAPDWGTRLSPRLAVETAPIGFRT